MRYPEDLDQAGEEAIAGLIRAIAGESAYDTLVVDIGSGRRTALSVMKLCRGNLYADPGRSGVFGKA